MKITGYHTHVIGTPWRNLTVLVLETDQGITGLGEARVVGKTHTVLEFLKDVRRHFIGHEFTDIEDLYQRFTLLDYGSAGEIAMTGLALVEMACWDLIGKKANMPVYQLIGGKFNDKVQAYANGWYKVERTPEAFAEASKAVIAKGYKAMKFDPFGSGLMELSPREFVKSIEIVEAIKDAVPEDTELLIEMHGRFAPHTAVRIAKALEPFNPGWIEEPCRPEDAGALAHIARHTTIPIATGERYYHAQQFRDLFQQRAMHIIQPDLNQCGGLFEVKKIASTAETYSMMIAPHNVGGAISTTAALHMMTTLRNGKILEHFNDFTDQGVQDTVDNYPKVVDGYFQLPKGPGWGLELNLDVIETMKPEKTDDGVILDPGLNMFKKSEWNQRDG